MSIFDLSINPSILYIDNENATTKQLTRFFNFISSNIFLCTNYDDAIKTYKKNKIDIVISEISISGSHDFEIVKKIKKLHKHQHIIIITKHTKKKYLIEALNLKVDGYILKPVSLFKLEKQLIEILKEIEHKNRKKLEKERLKLDLKEEVAKRHEQELVLFNQAKFAQIGSMINIIAHQWKQPLSTISTSAITLSMKNINNTLTKEDIEKISKTIQKKVQFISDILYDFIDFNKSNITKNIVLLDSFNKIKQMLSNYLEVNSVNLNIDIEPSLEVFHNSNFVEYTILNILLNSIDAFNENRVKNRVISIYTKKDNDKIVLYIEDNAGGIAKNIIDKVFNPYFSTKENSDNLGVGLYISKNMIESVNGSLLDLKVKDNSTIFKIVFKA